MVFEERFVPIPPTGESVDIVQNKFGEAEINELTKKCVRAAMVLGQEQNSIKRRDLNKLAFSPNLNHRVVGALIELANFKLFKSFGMRLYELDTKYLLVNCDPQQSIMIKYSDFRSQELALLYLTLVDIFGSTDNRLLLDQIINSLEPLQLDRETLKRHLEMYMKKLYLTQQKYNDKIYYIWGSRAKAEIDPDEFFNSFLDLSGTTSQDDWPEQKLRIQNLKSIANRTIQPYR